MCAAAFAIADTVAVTPENQVEQRALEKAKLYPPQPLHTQPLKLSAEKLDDIAAVLRLVCGDSSELAGLYETVDAEDLKAAKAARKKRTVAAKKRALGILLGAAGIRDGTTTTPEPESQATSSSGCTRSAPHFHRGRGDRRCRTLSHRLTMRNWKATSFMTVDTVSLLLRLWKCA